MKTAIFLILAMFSHLSFAGKDAEIDKCISAKFSTMVMNDCLKDLSYRKDKELDVAYGKLVKEMFTRDRTDRTD